MLFVQGSRDAFGTEEEVGAIIKKHRLLATLYVIEAGDHSFKVPKSASVQQADVHRTIQDRIETWLRTIVSCRV